MRYRLDIHENCPMSSSAELCRVATAYVEEAYSAVQTRGGWEFRNFRVTTLTLSQFAPGTVTVRGYADDGQEIITFVLKYDEKFKTWKLQEDDLFGYSLADLYGATVRLMETRRTYR